MRSITLQPHSTEREIEGLRTKMTQNAKFQDPVEDPKMRKEEIVRKNIGLTFDFIRAAIEDPNLLDNIPDGAEIEFLA